MFLGQTGRAEPEEVRGNEDYRIVICHVRHLVRLLPWFHYPIAQFVLSKKLR